MKLDRKLAVILGLGCIASLSAAAGLNYVPKEDVKYTNLKVLPKDVSSKVLQGLMVDDFQDALGVNCSFCHANSKDGHGLDFASDAKPEKEITRQMMRLTMGINKKYFNVKHPVLGSDALTVSCNTCHKGQAFPDGAEGK